MINYTITVLCYVYNDAAKQVFEEEIGCYVSIKEFREAAEIRLNLSNPQAYRLLLERDSRHLRILNDYKTFKSENVRQDDKLVYFPFDSLPDSIFFPNEQLVIYILTLKYPGISPNPQYSIHINSLCENNPKTHYFANSEINGRLKFEKFLREKVQKEISKEEIDRIIEFWCKDIRQGFQTTTLSL